MSTLPLNNKLTISPNSVILEESRGSTAVSSSLTVAVYAQVARGSRTWFVCTY